MSSIESDPEINAFQKVVDYQVASFESAQLLRRVADSSVTLTHYQSILATLFHQTLSSPYTFAKAASNCDWKHANAKEYLLQHAFEERSHWRWIIDDLSNTGFRGPDPRRSFPNPTCETYIAFNELVADKMPIARLAIARVLEGIGATFGSVYGRKLMATIQISPNQATFFLSHGDTDKAHVRELASVIKGCDLAPLEWDWMRHAANMAGTLYRAMYDQVTFAQCKT